MPAEKARDADREARTHRRHPNTLRALGLALVACLTSCAAAPETIRPEANAPLAGTARTAQPPPETASPPTRGASTEARPALAALRDVLASTPLDSVPRHTGAVTLLYKSRERIRTDGHHEQSQYTAIAVLDEDAARDYAEVGITFNSHTIDVWLDFARVHYPDGSVKTVSADAVQYKVPGNSIEFTDTRVLAFALPTPTSGSLIEFQTSSTTKSSPIPGEFFGYWQFHYVQSKFGWNRWRVDPLMRSSFELDIPIQRSIVHAAYRNQIVPTIETSADRRIYRWRARNLAELVPEEWMAPGITQIPGIWFSSMNGWESVDAWAHELYDAASVPTEALTALARETTRGATSPAEKAKALFEYVQREIRYIQAGFQRGGLEPHPAEQVIEQQYGDCKDQTVLLIALLRAVGVEAHPAFINTYTDGYLLTSVPSLAFSHAIVFVPNGGVPLWIDTSNDVAGFPGLHWTSQGRQAFVVNGRGGQLTETAVYPSELNRGSIREHGAALAGESMRSIIEYEASGANGELLKAAFLHSAEREKEMTRYVRWMYPTANLTSIEFPGLHDPTRSFSAVSQIEIPVANAANLDSFRFGGNGATVLLFTGLEHLDDPRRRHNDFVIPYTFEWSHESSCAPPLPGMELVDTPEDASVGYGPFTFEKTYTPEANGLLVRQRTRMTKGRVSVDDYPELYAAVEKAKEISKWSVDFVRPDQLPESVRIERSLEKEGRKPETLTRLARTMLGEGRHEQALEVVDEALGLDPNLAEAHYVRGLAKAYLGDDAASAASFARARELGYEP